MSSHEVQAHLAGSGIKWLFNVEKAPWWGGLFERLIKSTKRCLRKLIGRAKLDYDELSTLLAEIEMVINSRPLTYVSSEDIQEPLTPSHFLTGRRIMSVPDSLCSPDPDDFSASKVEDLTRRIRHLNKLLEDFWKRWRDEYLFELRECHRYNVGDQHAVPVQENDIVLV